MKPGLEIDARVTKMIKILGIEDLDGCCQILAFINQKVSAFEKDFPFV